MNRSELQDLAQLRLDEAVVLLAAGKYDGAYYLAGYAVECAIKACIARLANQYDFPPNNTKNSHYTHNLRTLVETAKLTNDLTVDSNANSALKKNWAQALGWDEGSRYQRKSRSDAEALMDAITEPTDGVLQWLKLRW